MIQQIILIGVLIILLLFSTIQFNKWITRNKIDLELSVKAHLIEVILIGLVVSIILLLVRLYYV